MESSFLEGQIKEVISILNRDYSIQNNSTEKKKSSSNTKQLEPNKKEANADSNNIPELMDYLRVCVKYQAFDLEATRRENTYLREIIERR